MSLLSFMIDSLCVTSILLVSWFVNFVGIFKELTWVLHVADFLLIFLLPLGFAGSSGSGGRASVFDSRPLFLDGGVHGSVSL